MQIAIDLPWARQRMAPIEVPGVELPRVDLAATIDDTKRAVSEGADTISSVAQDLSSQAATIGREAIKIAGDAAKAGRTAAKKGQLFAATSGDTLRQLRADAASAADDLRSIRIVREKQRGVDLKPGLALLAGISAGIAAMFFFDPEQGRGRRVLFMEQLHKYTRRSTEWLGSSTRNLRNRTQGLAAEARKAADTMRAQRTELEDDVLATPDSSAELSSTDWKETEPVTAESYRGN